MKVYAMVKKGSNADKAVCEDSLLFRSVSVHGYISSVICGSTFHLDFPSDFEYLAALSDGIGGSNAGEVASRFILNKLAGTSFPVELSRDHIIAEIKSINEQLIKLSQEDKALSGMGATLSGIISGPEYAWLFHTGNSRVYVTNGGFLRQLTNDHTRSHKKPWQKRDSRILSCMGGGKLEHLDMLQITDIQQFLPQPGTNGKIIITTDGIHDHMDNEDLEDLLSLCKDDISFCNEAMKLAQKNESDDDMSILVITP